MKISECKFLFFCGILRDVVHLYKQEKKNRNKNKKKIIVNENRLIFELKPEASSSKFYVRLHFLSEWIILFIKTLAKNTYLSATQYNNGSQNYYLKYFFLILIEI